MHFNLFLVDMETEKGNVEPNMNLELESEALPETSFDKKTSDALLDVLYACPHGVKAMSMDMPGLVETSTNLASVKMKEEKQDSDYHQPTQLGRIGKNTILPTRWKLCYRLPEQPLHMAMAIRVGNQT